MEISRLEEKLEKNTEDIGQLTVNMAKLTQITENVERRHEESMTAVKEIMVGIEKLFEKDVTMLKDNLHESKSDIRTLKHDLSNVMNIIQVIPEMNKVIIETKTRVDGLEKTKNMANGGIIALKNTAGLWYLLFGSSIGAFIMYVVARLGVVQ